MKHCTTDERGAPAGRWRASAMLAAWLGIMAVIPLPLTASEVVLVHEGTPRAIVVLPDRSGRDSMERQAAELLVRHIERMSGATIEIKEERELDAVSVEGDRIASERPEDVLAGREHVPGEAMQDPPQPVTFVLVGEGELARELNVNADGLGPGGLRIESFENGLVLLGGPARVAREPGKDEAGVRHAVIELLERLGWRYLWPGASGWVIPERPTLVVEPMETSYTPSIRRRGIRGYQDLGRLHGRSRSGLERLGISHEDWQAGRERAMDEQLDVGYDPWSRWQRLGGDMVEFGHAGGGLRDWERHHEENRDWFALQADGTRDQRGQSRFRLCKSNPELIEHVANDIIERKREDPDLELVSLDTNDGSRVSWCMCESCKALDPPDGPEITLQVFERPGASARENKEYVSLTDRLLFYWNSIAERVTEEHSDLLFGISAYSVHSHPPVERRLHPNLVVRYVTSVDHLPAWEEAGARRVYWRPNILNTGRWDGKLRAYLDRLTDDFRAFADAGVIQTDFDSIRHYWATHGFNYFAAARLNWDPYLSKDQIIGDFAYPAFGDGAEYIEQYIRRIEALTREGVRRSFRTSDDYRFTPETVEELRNLLNAAEESADDPAVSQRVAFLRLGLNFTDLQERLTWKSWRASEGEDYDEALAERLIDLNALMFRDIVVNHSWTVNTPHMVWRSATLSMFSPIGGRTVAPSDEAMLERIDDPDYGLTGHEDSIEAMLEAFGL